LKKKEKKVVALTNSYENSSYIPFWSAPYEAMLPDGSRLGSLNRENLLSYIFNVYRFSVFRGRLKR
jgi:hypothetical protein